MRVVVQRVGKASVAVEGECIGEIGAGLVVLVAIGTEDGAQDITFTKRKLLNLRVFSDSAGKMNCSVQDTGGELLLISQFTLYGDCRKGNRPSFTRAAPPEKAQQLFNLLVEELRAEGIRVATGRFRAMMDVALVNQGPVTLIFDSKKKFY